ncbi:rifin PIR protein,putative [Plasmodium sp. DRC-Itaito]|nr:rifin PIR protein,putative [Plasmodium sp. DRC-Itaito]
MKVHYINILLFAHALNILVNTHKKTSITHYTQTNRSLSECELYAPVIYDNDPQMKAVMENFDRQTSQRFHEYDERMKTTRQKCKEQCDKESQKIILKDKLEKELIDKFATLQTDIQSDAIPTCVCEKSIADKVEKGCLRCGGVLSGGVAPGWGLISGLGYATWTNYVAGIAAKAATKVGIDKAIAGLGEIYELSKFSYMNWAAKVTATNFDKPMELLQIVKGVSDMCADSSGSVRSEFCIAKQMMSSNEDKFVQLLSKKALGVAADAGETAKTAGATETAKFATNTSVLTNTIIVSIVAIVVIVLIMVIIYLILRYRRKKKMKKKLQYIKLLEE